MIKESSEEIINHILPSDLRSEEQIIASWSGDIESPLLSIKCIAYNHEQYIEDAIVGILRQETDFPVEILIHDDASTDLTADIIKKYENQYPQLIKAIYQVENQYSKGRKPAVILDDFCRGSYIAMCEGDDYWTDPSKLQKQVTFLEENQDYVISGHDAFIIDESNKIKSESKLPVEQKRDFSSKEVSKGKAWILTMSWVYRNVLHEEVPEMNMVKNGDTFFVSLLGKYGGSHYHKDINPAAYRVHPGGVWSSIKPDVKKDEAINTWFWMYRYYSRVGDSILSKYYFHRFLRAALERSSFSAVFKESLFKLIKFQILKNFIRKLLGERMIKKLKGLRERK